MILSFFSKFFDYAMFAFIAANVILRKYRNGNEKRFSTVLAALIILTVYFLLVLREHFSLPPWTEWLCLLLGALLALVLRKKLFVWRIRCRKCGRKLERQQFWGNDSNLCLSCWEEEHPEEKEKREKEERAKTGNAIDVKEAAKNAEKIDDIPWGRWEADEKCVLTHIFNGDEMLLIYKKKGLGEGYVNACGGHIETEETKWEAAVREAEEETGLHISDLKEAGILNFQFRDGYAMTGYVFTTDTFSGTLITECEETRPFWQKREDLDYSAMWADDRIWLPLLLEGKKFEAWFLFDGRTLLDHRVETEDE